MSDTVHSTYRERFNASYGEAFSALSDRYSLGNDQGLFRNTITPFIKKHPMRTAALAGASGLAILTGVHEWGLVATAAQAIGIAGFFLSKEAAVFKEHRHILALASVACVFATAQQAALGLVTGNPGAYIPGGVMVAHAAATLGAFAVIPETQKLLRKAVTWGGGLIGAAGAAYASYKFENGSGLIPAATTLANSVIFSIKDGNTPRARMGYIGMNLAHLYYFATQPVATATAVAAELMYLGTHATTLRHNDVPVQDKDTGESYSRMKRLSLYFKHVIGRGEKAEDLGRTRVQNGEQRPDDRFYRACGRLILGNN